MKVSLRQRKKGNTISLYLDFYDKDYRKTEFLNLYLTPEPEKGKLTKQQKDENRENFETALRIASKRHLEIVNGNFGFQSLNNNKGSFINYMENLAEKRKSSIGNYGNWDSTLKHVKKFSKTDITFAHATSKWLENFKDYLIKEARTPSGKPLAQNSQCSYFNKVRATFNQAFKEGIILQNPVHQVDCIKQGDTERSFLTEEEIQLLVKTECENPVLKKAFLFSCITGMRWSDIQKLHWSELQHSGKEGYYIRFTQQKTKSTETLHIPDQVVELIGSRGDSHEKIFPFLKYSAWHNIKLREWVMRAGITKSITFHCGRHSYATMLLTNDVDLYTVSKMLGHKNIKTTQEYGRIINSKKREAANTINIKFK